MKPRCPQFPQKRTFGSAILMSALCQKRTSELAGVTFGAVQHRQLGDVARNPSSRVSKLGLRIARPDSLIESFGFSFCF